MMNEHRASYNRHSQECWDGDILAMDPLENVEFPVYPYDIKQRRAVNHFTYYIVCEVQELKESGITQHPLNWFDDFEEYEHLLNFNFNYLNSIKSRATDLNELYEIFINLPYARVVELVTAQEIEKQEPQLIDINYESDSEEFHSAVEEIEANAEPPTSEEEDELHASHPDCLQSTDTTDQPVVACPEGTPGHLVKLMIGEAKAAVALLAKKVGLSIQLEQSLKWKPLSNRRPVRSVNNYFLSQRPRCLLYLPSERHIDWLRKTSDLDFNTMLDMKWKKWKPLVVTCNPNIKRRYWYTDPAIAFGYNRISNLDASKHLTVKFKISSMLEIVKLKTLLVALCPSVAPT